MKESLTTWRKTKNIVDNVLNESIGNTKYSTTSIEGLINVIYSPNTPGRKLTNKDRRYFIQYVERTFNVILPDEDVHIVGDSFQVTFDLKNRNGYDMRHIFAAIFKIKPVL